MQRAVVRAYISDVVHEIDDRIYSGFVEHLGRCVYGGIYEPSHPEATENGFRSDVIAAMKTLDIPLVRYPGGNFVSSYRWEDGVGPRESRPVRLDLAWRSLEPNSFGTNEFMKWLAAIGSRPMLAVNLGTRGVEEACNLLEYCNHPSGTFWSDLRQTHGHSDPHNVPVWCLGNEMDGPWQIGQKSAAAYGRLAAETAKAMRQIDPTIELVACGSSNPRMATFPDWESTVLDLTYDRVDYVSLHIYLRDELGVQDLLVHSVEMDQQIRAIVSVCDVVRARKRSSKQMMLSFDEWNVWYHRVEADRELQRDRPWQIGPPLLEEPYTVADAVAVGSMLLTLLRHAGRVRIACLAQLVNVIAPLMTVDGGPMWKQTIWYPFEHASRYGRGRVIYASEHGPVIETVRYGDQPAIQTIVTRDENAGSVTVFSVNRSVADSVLLEVDFQDQRSLMYLDGLRLSDFDLGATNTAADPLRVVPKPVTDALFDGRQLQAPLPPCSWNVFRFVDPGLRNLSSPQ